MQKNDKELPFMAVIMIIDTSHRAYKLNGGQKTTCVPTFNRQLYQAILQDTALCTLKHL